MHSTTVTINKIKHPKRFLNDTMKNLYEKFKFQNPDVILGYDLFTKIKSKYILIPKLKDREECLCKNHENFRLLCSRFKFIRLIETIDPIKLITSNLCFTKTKNCFYNDYDKCKVKHNFDEDLIASLIGKQIELYQWESINENNMRKEKKLPKIYSIKNLGYSIK